MNGIRPVRLLKPGARERSRAIILPQTHKSHRYPGHTGGRPDTTKATGALWPVALRRDAMIAQRSAVSTEFGGRATQRRDRSGRIRACNSHANIRSRHRKQVDVPYQAVYAKLHQPASFRWNGWRDARQLAYSITRAALGCQAVFFRAALAQNARLIFNVLDMSSTPWEPFAL